MGSFLKLVGIAVVTGFPVPIEEGAILPPPSLPIVRYFFEKQGSFFKNTFLGQLPGIGQLSFDVILTM
mgnify:CR=1 FL=1